MGLGVLIEYARGVEDGVLYQVPAVECQRVGRVGYPRNVAQKLLRSVEGMANVDIIEGFYNDVGPGVGNRNYQFRKVRDGTVDFDAGCRHERNPRTAVPAFLLALRGQYRPLVP